MLSKKKLDFIKGWEEIEKSKEEGAILDGTVVEAVKGGMIVLVNGVRIFVPASQAANGSRRTFRLWSRPKSVSASSTSTNKEEESQVPSAPFLPRKEKPPRKSSGAKLKKGRPIKALSIPDFLRRFRRYRRRGRHDPCIGAFLEPHQASVRNLKSRGCGGSPCAFF